MSNVEIHGCPVLKRYRQLVKKDDFRFYASYNKIPLILATLSYFYPFLFFLVLFALAQPLLNLKSIPLPMCIISSMVSLKLNSMSTQILVKEEVMWVCTRT